MSQKKNNQQLFKYFAILVCTIFSLMPDLIANDEYFRAMQDEMDRSMKQLHFENQQHPYYIEYTIEIRHSNRTEATLGKILQGQKNNFSAEISVAVRVGDYKFDQRNFFDFGLNY
jgi:hypothetical protein